VDETFAAILSGLMTSLIIARKIGVSCVQETEVRRSEYKVSTTVEAMAENGLGHRGCLLIRD
jgi:hypothetical protein